MELWFQLVHCNLSLYPTEFGKTFPLTSLWGCLLPTASTPFLLWWTGSANTAFLLLYLTLLLANSGCSVLWGNHKVAWFTLLHLSDRDVVFFSQFWQEVFRLSRTRLRMGTSYDPQSDGQMEVVNRCLEAYFRCFAHEKPKFWYHFLAWSAYSFNTGYHSSTNTVASLCSRRD